MIASKIMKLLWPAYLDNLKQNAFSSDERTVFLDDYTICKISEFVLISNKNVITIRLHYYNKNLNYYTLLSQTN